MNPLGKCAACSRDVPTLDHGRAVPHNRPDTADLCKGSGRQTSYQPPAAPRSTEPEWYTVAEVADAMRVSKMTVYRLAHDGELPAHRIGRSMRIHRNSLASYMHAAEIRP